MEILFEFLIEVLGQIILEPLLEIIVIGIGELVFLIIPQNRFTKKQIEHLKLFIGLVIFALFVAGITGVIMLLASRKLRKLGIALAVVSFSIIIAEIIWGIVVKFKRKP